MRYAIHTAKERRLAVAKLQGGFFCYYCEAPESETEKGSLIVDHVIARSCGGTEDLRNLVLACQPCNLRKSDKHADVLRKDYGYETLADRIEGVQSERANWGPEAIKHALAQPVNGVDPGYNAYEKFIVETPTAQVINAALTYSGKSAERVRQEAKLGGWTLDRLRRETQKGTISMWHRLATVTGYPIQAFLKVHQKWLSQPDSVHREIEYAAALRGLDATGIAMAVDATPNAIRRFLQGHHHWTRGIRALATAIAMPEATLSQHLQTLAKTRPLPLPLPLPRPLPLPLPRPLQLPVPRPLPRPRPLPLPLPRPRPLPLPRAYQKAFQVFIAETFRSQTVAARQLGYSPSMISELLGGWRLPNVALFTRVCEFGGLDKQAILVEVEKTALGALAINLPLRFHDVLFPNGLCYLADQTVNGLGAQIGYSGAYISQFFTKASPNADIVSRLAPLLQVSEETLLRSIEKRCWLTSMLPTLPKKAKVVRYRSYIFTKVLLAASAFQMELSDAVTAAGSCPAFGNAVGLEKIEKFLCPDTPRVPLGPAYIKCLKGMGIPEDKYLMKTLDYERQAIENAGWHIPAAYADTLSLPMQLLGRGLEIKYFHELPLAPNFTGHVYKRWLETGNIEPDYQERIAKALGITESEVVLSVKKAQWLRTEIVLSLTEKETPLDKRGE